MEGLFYSNVEQTIRQNISKHLFNILLMSFLTFYYSFVQTFNKYFTGCVFDIKPMFEKNMCNMQMYNIHLKCQ